MITLGTSKIEVLHEDEPIELIGRISTNPLLPPPLREKEIFFVKSKMNVIPEGFGSYFFSERENVPTNDLPRNAYFLPADLAYMSDGDVIRFHSASRSLRVLYRKKAHHNALLLTERCNNWCLMCSQPPKTKDDSYLVDELLKAIPLMSKDTVEIGFTGGEPTLLGDDLIRLITATKNYLPSTALHILSNGRNLSKEILASKIAAIQHHDLMFGIPLYSDISNLHDFVVQGDGAYDETIKGIMNLKRYGVKIEIRVVIHQQTFKRFRCALPAD